MQTRILSADDEAEHLVAECPTKDTAAIRICLG
jgi:hypothetical protein